MNTEHSTRMKQLEVKVFHELPRSNLIVRAVFDAGRYQDWTQYDMLLEMVVALAESNKQTLEMIMQIKQNMPPAPLVIRCTPEQAAEFFKGIEPGEVKQTGDL
jgi:hypothetical protein